MMRRTHRMWMLLPLSLVILLGTALPSVRPAAAETCHLEPVRDEAAASQLLATERPFAPANRDRFQSFAHPDWADMAAVQYATGPAASERETRDALQTFLARRFPCDPQSVRNGLEIYDYPLAREKLPDPTLRAALAALTGTLGEPAISYILLEAPIVAIRFGVVIHYQEGLPDKSLAASYHLPDGTSTIVVDGRLRYNPFGTFSALLFHEALHVESTQAVVGLTEEIAAISLEALVYMEMLLTDPSLAGLPDPLTRGSNNHTALVRLNSGLGGSDRLNLFLPGNETNVDPLAIEPLTEFSAFYASNLDTASDPGWRERETAGSPLLAAVLAALAEPGRTPPTQPAFDRATLDFIDQNHAVLSPGELIAVACILELDVDCE